MNIIYSMIDWLLITKRQLYNIFRYRFEVLTMKKGLDKLSYEL